MTTYPFIRTDAGRAQSRRPRQKSDCTVRAVATATGMTYDATYDLLKAAGRESHDGFHLGKWLKTDPVPGYRFEWIPFPAVKGQRRMNPATFCAQFANGRYIIRVSKHVAAVVGGVLYDESYLYEERCVYGCWKLVEKTT